MAITPITAAGLIAFGLFVGTYGTMVGAGGGFLIVPMLLLVAHVPPAQAAGTSLAVIFLNATTGSLSYWRQGRVDNRSGFFLALPTIPGSIAGAFVAARMSGPAFNVAFALLLLAIAFMLLLKPERKPVEWVEHPESERTWWRISRVIHDNYGHTFQYQYNLAWGLAISFFVGFFSSILGLGGAIIHIPAMIYLLNFPPHVAAATSHFILAISSLVGAGTHIALGHVLFVPAALMGIGVIAGAQIGARIARRVKGAVTVRLLSIALIVVAIRLLLR